MLLLDTHVALWWGLKEPIAPRALASIEAARQEQGVLFAAVSAWEIAHIERKAKMTFAGGAIPWIQNFLRVPGVHAVDLTVEIELESTQLPNWTHGDPADRFLVATARALRIPIATRDRAILAYAEAGHVRAISC